MARVKVVHWNPPTSRRLRPVSPLVPASRRMNNFGDLLGPLIVSRLLADEGIPAASAPRPHRLLAVGSIIRLAREGDTVWGSGVNGKSVTEPFGFSSLDVRAVRGPLTRAVLRERGIAVPEVYGDPGLLVGSLWGREVLARGFAARPLTVLPNFHDFPLYPADDALLDPRSDLWHCLGTIAASDFVVGSSLHAIVIAEALGIPARLVRSGSEPSFKYSDYYEGTGRSSHRAATSVAEALDLGGEPPPVWDAAPLLAAFPRDLWLTGRPLSRG